MKILKEYKLSFVFLLVWIMLLLWFWLFDIIGSEILYSLIAFYMLLPALSFVISYKVSRRNYRMKWFILFALGFMSILLSWLTFGLANHLAISNSLISLDLDAILLAFVPAIIGFIIGNIRYNYSFKKK